MSEGLRYAGGVIPTETKMVQVWRVRCPAGCPSWQTGWHTKLLPDLQSEVIRHLEGKHPGWKPDAAQPG